MRLRRRHGVTRRERARALCLCPLAAALVACSHQSAAAPKPDAPYTEQAVRAAFTNHGIRLTPYAADAAERRALRADHVLAGFFGSVADKVTASVLVFDSAARARRSPTVSRSSPLCRARCADDPRLTARHERLLNVVVDSLYTIRPGRTQRRIDAALRELSAGRSLA